MQEKVFIPNKTGLKLAAIIEKPKSKGKFPFVILLHGFKGYKEEPTYSKLANELLKIGIGSIRFDASGFGESEGDFQKEYRLTNYVSDTEAVYQWLLEQRYVDEDRMGVMGQSMGGALAIILASKFPEIKAVVSISPPDIFATRDDFGKRLNEWKEKGYIEIDSSRMGKLKVPYEYALDAKKYDIRAYAKKVKASKMFILGLADITIDPGQTRDVFRAAAEPKELLEIKGMDHFYKNDREILDKVNKYIVEFFKKSI
ncbi:MAG: Alpha/beta superfamily hydrolase [Candidatus Woesebacteria bacterium GW2011_GWA1_39_12]|uniref:Alpha/beta superfamily hydrolase n=1 Tax=Candidatus Woesebacteria bacterium GW2011_GWA1_39_12 TaxID=1618549 RepID=A0A0G0Q8W7_9BACT|nr:MAG: Alpha/beta superfamily hydrolase [Candidatus Woesebacteria bacterium GW2011_GWA1_39_12]